MRHMQVKCHHFLKQKNPQLSSPSDDWEQFCKLVSIQQLAASSFCNDRKSIIIEGSKIAMNVTDHNLNCITTGQSKGHYAQNMLT